MGNKYIIEIIGGEEGDMDFSTIEPYTEPNMEQVRKEAYDKGYTDAAYNCHERCAFLDDAKEEAYQRGYETAKHECEDCQKIRTDAEQELADKAYQKGLSDAWEAARKIQDTGRNLSWWIHNTSATEAIEKIQQYEREKEEIQVGDEVRSIHHGWTAVVSAIDRECMTLMDTNGELGDGYDVNRFTKTGRHFPEIAEVLAKMKES